MARVLKALLRWLLCAGLAASASAQDYKEIDAVFSKYCLDCHSSKDPDAKLVLEDFDGLMKGGEDGPVIVPGDSGASMLVRMVEGTLVKNGKTLVMPPAKKKKKLEPAEISAIKTWIDAGAPAPVSKKIDVADLKIPKISPVGIPRDPINALLDIPNSDQIALARYGEIELRSAQNGEVKRTLSGHHGNVNALALSPDGARLYSAAGEAVRFGEIKRWNLADGSLLGTTIGHKDAIYALAISPDGKTVASGSYDQTIKLWNIDTGEELKTLTGHNGAVFGLAFRPDGKFLASASADHTVKLWDVATGKRTDTLSQPLKDLFAVAFSPDGNRLVAGGVDNRIRLWQISPSASETNSLLESVFAHEGAILRLAFSPDGKWLLSSADDRTVRLWDAVAMKERLVLEKQPDWPTGVDFVRHGKAIGVGRLDGSLAIYDFEGKSLKLVAEANASKPRPTPDKPEITRVEPPGMQRGTSKKFKITGMNLYNSTKVSFDNSKLNGHLEPGAGLSNAWITVNASADLSPGPYEFRIANPGGETAGFKIYIGRLPHAFGSLSNALSLPVTYWGVLDPPGRADEISFRVGAGETIVFNLAARGIGSQLNGSLTLLDAAGQSLASQGEFDGGDPLLAWTFASAGLYKIRVADETANGSPAHYYSLSMGQLPTVTAVFPPSLATNAAAEVQLIGYNLTGIDKVRVQPGKPGELEVPLDLEKYFPRRQFKILVTDGRELLEPDTNNSPAQAMLLPVPCTVSGRINPGRLPGRDADFFRFDAQSGEPWIIETDASRRGSPIDTKIEVLQADGAPIQRLQLQAMRDSALDFRTLNSTQDGLRVDNWVEMELNQYLYLQGEVCKLFRMPQGPDSDMVLYSRDGKRLDYFDTSGSSHALDEPCYIVEPHPPGEKLVPNGLPIFPLYYANDDDGDRRLGTDSRLHFTAPSNGTYLIRVTDTRNYGGTRYFYRLIVRRPEPDFEVTLDGKTLAPSAGAGREFTVTANRTDGFDSDITVDISGVPAGFKISSPLVIQAGHDAAKGVINCETNASSLTNSQVTNITVTARAWINGAERTRSVAGFEKISVGEPSKLWVALEPYDVHATNFVLRSVARKPLEITIQPGGSATAWIKIQRHGHDDLVDFSPENLPHGVIVDNIGLNGVLIPKDENRRQIFLQAERWVPDADRLFYVRAAEADNPASLPVLLHVRSSPQTVRAMK